MKTLCVLQHVEAEYLGLLEDHFEGRNIRFRYCRPFAPGVLIPPAADEDGLVLLGGGPKGIVSGDLIPSLGAELRLTRDYLERGLPVIGIGIGPASSRARRVAEQRRRSCALCSTMPAVSSPTRSTGICRKFFR